MKEQILTKDDQNQALRQALSTVVEVCTAQELDKTEVGTP